MESFDPTPIVGLKLVTLPAIFPLSKATPSSKNLSYLPLKLLKYFESKGFELEEIRTKKIGEAKEQKKGKNGEINVKLMA